MNLLKKLFSPHQLSIKQINLFLSIFFISIFVRFWKMEFIPFQNHADELAYIWAGTSLFDLGKPISWSSFKYPREKVYLEAELGDEKLFARDPYTLVGPWFDHPFLIPIVEGVLLKSLGFSFPDTPPSLIYRLPTLLFAALGLWFFFMISLELFDFKSSLLSFIIFAFSPSIIIGQRMLVGENFYMTFILISIYLLIRNKTVNWQIIALNVLSLLAKFTGILATAISSLYFLLTKQYKQFLINTLFSIFLFVVIYFCYASMFGLDDFLFSLKNQSFRLIGWSNPSSLLTTPGFLNFTLFDLSYYLILFLFIFCLFFKEKDKHFNFLLFASLLSFLMIWSTSSEFSELSWYKIPFFTLAALCTGKIFTSISQNKFLIFLSIVIINNLGLIRYPTEPRPTTELLRLVLGIFFLGILLFYLFDKKIKFSQKTNKITVVIIAIYILQSFIFVDKYFESSCQDIHCPTPSVRATHLIEDYQKIKP